MRDATEELRVALADSTPAEVIELDTGQVIQLDFPADFHPAGARGQAILLGKWREETPIVDVVSERVLREKIKVRSKVIVADGR